MDIDNLTFGQLKQIATMFSSPAAASASSKHPMIGEYCIARCYSAGVHAGEVVSVDGENVILKDSRRLWSWKAQDGLALSGVAQHGIKSKESKVDVLRPVNLLDGGV